MSKAAKQSIIILIFLLLLAMGFAGFSLIEKQRVVQEKQSMQTDIQTYQTQAQKYKAAADQAQASMQQIVDEKNKLAEQLSGVDAKIKEYETQITQLKTDRDEWKQRLDTIQQERDQLLVKLKERPEEAEPKIVYKYIEKEPEQKLQEAPQVAKQPAVDPSKMDDQYWAGVLKEKAALDVAVEKLKSELSDYALMVDELKEDNAHLTLELSKVQNEKEAIEREIKYGKDLADTLSLELARAKGDKKFMADRMEKIQAENEGLSGQIKDLMSTKIALEKTIVRITDDKNGLEKKLAETENVIQSKIEEIWQIKHSLNERLQKAAADTSSQEIELPPIIVSANNTGSRPKTVKEQAENSGVAGFNGNVISVNDENNFVIIDLGKERGINIGDVLNVYRDTDYVGAIEVIQVRKDIAAADIKERNTSIKVGDSVK